MPNTEQPGGFHRLDRAEDSPAVLLARIDERLKSMQGDVDEIKKELGAKYVTLEAFNNLREQVTLLRNIIFGLFAIIGIAVIGAIMRLIMTQPAGGN